MSRVIVAILIFIMPSALAAGDRCEHAKVIKVIDGDTIRVKCDGKRVLVRLIGIDTPETHRPGTPVQCYGPEATVYLQKRIGGKRVRLAYGDEETDKYGRTLAYVYRGRTFINAEMIKRGYAFAYRRFPFAYRGEFIGYETEARQQGRGLWGACPVKCRGEVCRIGGEHHVPGR